MQGRVLLSSSPSVQLEWWYKGRRDLFLCVPRLPPAFELSFFPAQTTQTPKPSLYATAKYYVPFTINPCLGMARDQTPTLCPPETKVI
jgi:hypothetical protein